MLVTLNDSNVKIPVDLQDHMIPTNNPIPVVLPNKTAQEVLLFNALALRDTAISTGADANISNLTGQKNILVFNSLNQSANVNIVIKTNSGLGFQVLVNRAVGAGVTAVLTDVDIPVLRGPIQVIYAQVSCTVAPSSGTVSVILEGVGA